MRASTSRVWSEKKTPEEVGTGPDKTVNEVPVAPLHCSDRGPRALRIDSPTTCQSPFLMSNFPDHDVEPFDTGPLLWWVLGLLGAALVLEFFVSVPWTEPLTEPNTWVLIGVFVGFALRIAGRRLGKRGQEGSRAFRWMSVVVWAAAAGGGLLAWLL